MNALPAGWKLVELDDLQSDEPRAITDGPFGSNLARAHYAASGPRVVRLQNIGDGVFNDARAHISEAHFETLRSHEVLPGDLLVASLGEVLPRACIAPDSLGPAIVKADCIRVRLSQDVDPRWVMYSMQRPQVRRWADDHRHGVGRPRLGLKVIRQIPVPLPSLGEQRRIVDILEDHLSRLDAADAGTVSSIARLASLKERLLAAGLLGETVRGPRQPSDLTGCGTDDGQLSDLPMGWSWRRLGEITDVAGGVTKDSKRQSDPAFVEVPYLRVANVQRGRLDLAKVTKIRVPASKAKALRLLSGDVLMNEGGDRDKLARGWVWEGQIEDCIHQNHVFRARVVDEAIEPKLLSWTANTIGGRWAERNGKQSVNLASISLTKIRQMPVPVPPKVVQRELVRQLDDRLQACDRLAVNLNEARVRAVALRRSLLAAAFSGRLTGRSSDLDVAEELPVTAI